MSHHLFGGFYFPVEKSGIKTVEITPVKFDVSPKGTETILVVEDEEMLLELVKSFLETNGYRVLTAKDGAEAVEMYKRHKDAIALVLSDMGLPKIAGLEAFQLMKAINPEIKIIFASGYLDPELKSVLLQSGAKDFIGKPYTPDEVVKKVREILDAA